MQNDLVADTHDAAQSFSELLRRELDTAGFIPDADAYAIARARAVANGALLWERLLAAVGADCWSQANERLTLPIADADCERMLGFGRALTGYAVAPLDVPAAHLGDVLELGALTNFVVAVYDQFLDAGRGSTDVLPRGAVVNLLARDNADVEPDHGQAVCREAPERLLLALVGEFRRRLRALRLSDDRALLLQQIQRLILAMYDAEHPGPAVPAQVPVGQLRRRAALPFIVMGLPAWLTVPQHDQQLYGWHGRWLYRLGRFIGWVDDAVDTEEDRVTGQPNLVTLTLSSDQEPQAEHRLAKQITIGGVRVREEWRIRTSVGQATGPRQVDALSLAVCSWFGGIRPR
jgi:hypothetical protein